MNGLVAILAFAGAVAAMASLVGAVQSASAPKPAYRVGFTAVPPGPVTDKVRVELRLGLRNTGKTPVKARILFHADRRIPSRLIAEQTITLPAGSSSMVSAWWPTQGKVGSHRLLCRVECAGSTQDMAWPIEVIACPTRSLPYFQGAWIDGYGGMDAATLGADAVEKELRRGVDAMHRLGVRVLIYTYPEWYGKFYYPSKLEFFDRDIQATARGSSCIADAVGAVMDQAEKNGQHVIVGLGRNGDLHLLWEFDRPDWQERNKHAVEVAQKVAAELWGRYGRRKSFYGWYLTHEMNDLARSAAYYDPVARFCKGLAPEKPVLIAPAGTPIWTTEAIRGTSVDIFAPQDAVGAGYMPYVYTYDPAKRIAELDRIYAGYSRVFAGSDKHLWTDLEIWEMDGKSGYSNSYPPTMDRVRQQITAQTPHVDMLTAYTYFGFMQHPGAAPIERDARAIKLHGDYVAYLKELPPRMRPPAFR